MTNKPLFITLEGCDGVGKSTQGQRLVEYFKAQGIDAILTREPGGDAISEQIRQIIKTNTLSPETALFLFLAARTEHVTKTILPALNAGKVVICDRFTDSTIAYQGYGMGMNIDMIKEYNKVATKGLSPDITFVLMCDISTAQQRIDSRTQDGNDTKKTKTTVDQFENTEMQTKIYNGWQEMLQNAKQEERNMVCVNANQTADEMYQNIIDVIKKNTDKKTEKKTDKNTDKSYLQRIYQFCFNIPKILLGERSCCKKKEQNNHQKDKPKQQSEITIECLNDTANKQPTF